MNRLPGTNESPVFRNIAVSISIEMKIRGEDKGEVSISLNLKGWCFKKTLTLAGICLHLNDEGTLHLQ